MIHLTITHHIYLDRDQRYKLHNGEELEVLGITTPVWFFKGNTSEPAKEIFCKYFLTNNKNPSQIEAIPGGYQVNLPQKVENPENLKELSMLDIDTSEKLLDPKDKGSKYMGFRQYLQLEDVTIIHFVEIQSIEVLEETLS